jgi:hypothetical protein
MASLSDDPDSERPELKTKPVKLRNPIIPKAGNRIPGAAQAGNSVPVPAAAVSPSPSLLAAIAAAPTLSQTPRPYSETSKIKDLRQTVYAAWCATDKKETLFRGFTKDAEHLLGIVQAAFKVVFPQSPYIPQKGDIFHQTVCCPIFIICYWNVDYVE